MAVSQGSFTVGGGLADYPDLYSALGDVASPLTGDLTFQVINNHSSSDNGTVSSLDLQGYTLKITADVGPEGQVNNGRVISMAADVYGCNIVAVRDTVGGGNVIIERLSIKNIGIDYDQSAIRISTSSSIGSYLTVTIRDCVVDNRNATQAQLSSGIEILVQPGIPARIHNVRLFNCKVVGHYSQSGSACFELRGQYYGYVLCENCSAQPNSAVAAATGFRLPVGSPNVIVRSCMSIGGGVTFGDFDGIGQAEGYNNMSEDGTAADGNWNIGSGNVENITPADEYVSTDPATGANWFEPKATGQAKDGGAATVIVSNTYGAVTTIGRPHNTSQYSIGANEYPSSPTITVHPVLDRVNENGPASFSVTADNATGYQWQEGPLPGVGEARVFSNMPGETAATLDIASAGSSMHQYQYRCKVSNAAGEVTSDTAYLLINGMPDPGGGGAEAPDRPSVSLVNIDGLGVTFDVSGSADVFRAEVTDPNSYVVAYTERGTPGQLLVTLPNEGVNYVVSVYAGNYGSVVWSLPGYVLAILVAVTPTPAPPGEPLEISEVEPIFSDVDPELRTDHQGNIIVLVNEQAMNASIENIFDIGPGELVMDPLFGGEMKKMIARNVDDSSAAFIRMATNHSLRLDPRVKRDRLTVIPLPDDRAFHVVLEFSDNEGYIKGIFDTLLEK